MMGWGRLWSWAEGLGVGGIMPAGEVRVGVPPVARAVWVVKGRVTARPVLAAMRYPAAMAKVTEVGRDGIAPEAAPADAVVS